MDLATVIGFLLGAALVSFAIISGAGDQIGAFIDPGSAMIVIGGAIASSMMVFPLKHFLGTGKIFKNALFHKDESVKELIDDLVGYAEVARRDGILSLESATKDARDPFIVKGIQMAVDGTDPDLIEQIMESELDAISDRHDKGKAIFEALGRYAPAFGMIGTLVGLVIMLMNMDDPSKIGPGMAIALLTTMYGSMFANMFALPIADKLGMRNDEELLQKTIILKGVMSIQSGDNPRIVEQKLKTFLPPGLRGEEEAEEGE
jgi:chemotaxis protein MotA